MGIPRFSQKLPGLSRRGAAFVLQPGAATFTGEGSTGALDMKISILGLICEKWETHRQKQEDCIPLCLPK